MYGEILVIVGYAIDNWGSFDSWCLTHGGFDPLEISSRRMVNSIWAWMTENMEPEKIEELRLAIQPYTPPKRKPPKAEPYAEEAEKDKFRAPEGWKPAWYNEEKAYKAAQAFRAAQSSGFKKGGETE